MLIRLLRLNQAPKPAHAPTRAPARGQRTGQEQKKSRDGKVQKSGQECLETVNIQESENILVGEIDCEGPRLSDGPEDSGGEGEDFIDPDDYPECSEGEGEGSENPDEGSGGEGSGGEQSE